MLTLYSLEIGQIGFIYKEICMIVPCDGSDLICKWKKKISSRLRLRVLGMFALN